MAKDKEQISTTEKNAKLRAENNAKKKASDEAVRAASPVGAFQDRMKAIDEEQRFPGLKQSAPVSGVSGSGLSLKNGTSNRSGSDGVRENLTNILNDKRLYGAPAQKEPAPYRHPLPYRKTFMEQANNFDWSNRGPADAEATRLAAMKQLSEPPSTGEMIPSIASHGAASAPTQSKPIDLTKDIQRPTFDTATTNRLQEAPGAYEEAIKRLVPQKQMTATFNGQQFTAQPQARMDRTELERLIARKQLDEQKSIADADIQKGRDAQMAMARIPGENASALQKVKNEGELANTSLLNERAKAAAELQYANNDIERQVAQQKVKQIEQQMAQADTTFKDTQARKLTPEQEMADKALNDLVQKRSANPIIGQDPATKAAYDQLLSKASPAAQSAAAAANATTRTPMQAALSAVKDPAVEKPLNEALWNAMEITKDFNQKAGPFSYAYVPQSKVDAIKARIKRAYNVAVMNSPQVAPEAIKEQVLSHIQKYLPAEGYASDIAKDLYTALD